MIRYGILRLLSELLNKTLSVVDLRLVRASTFTKLQTEQRATEQSQRQQLTAIEDYLLDLLKLQMIRLDPESLIKLRIVTDHAVAIQSPDHISPRGTKNDNTRHPRFVAKCGRVFGRRIFHIDLGCAGGGLVWDFLIAGHQSYGVEGSDNPLVNQRALWRAIPYNLFTADITKPFHFLDELGAQRRFDLITAWEVLEHLARDSLSGFLENLRRNLDDNGLFVTSVATFSDQDPTTGTVWHATVEPKRWWIEQFEGAGFESTEGVFVPGDYARGSGNPRADDWDEVTDPSKGFHVVLRRK